MVIPKNNSMLAGKVMNLQDCNTKSYLINLFHLIVNMDFGKVQSCFFVWGLSGSSNIEPIFIQTVTDGVTFLNYSILNLKITLDLY